ncbi:hypothetical protein HDU87_002732 [Geranomyces variabilis]|uniref:Pericentriolar material 1 protein C-terminal domain-containing protein n=1 Tax=Geranomyces variabilis TaxID=109894 RepID=A0AAD5XTZ5_9FUNG|nr:hypothetical protein HDU87_002732 [Geranomyces variabilis]
MQQQQQQHAAPCIALDSPDVSQDGAAVSAERDMVSPSERVMPGSSADMSQLGQEGEAILQQLTREHGAQVQEAQFTRLALLELQKKRVQMEHARSTIMAALESGDMNALEKLKDLGALDGVEEEDVDEDLLDMIADAHELGVTREHIAKAMTQGGSRAKTNASASSQAQRASAVARDFDGDMTNEKLHEIMTTLASGEHDFDREAMAEVKRLKLMESWEELKTLKQQFNDLNRRATTDTTSAGAGGDDAPDSPDTGPYSSPEAMARGAAAADEKWQQVAALQEELGELQAYKERLEQRNHLLATQRGQRRADGSSDSLATLVRNSPGKQNGEGPSIIPRSSKNQTQNVQGNSRAQHQYNAVMPRSNSVTDHLIERLAEASVRNRAGRLHQSQTSRGPTRVEIIEESGAGNPLALKIREAHSAPNSTRHSPARKTPVASNLLDATPYQVLAAAERDTAIDAARVEQGLQEVLANMRTIQMARHVAKGPERAKFDAVFEQLQLQLAELQEVQSKVAYFRQLVEQQQEEQNALLSQGAQTKRVADLPQDQREVEYLRQLADVDDQSQKFEREYEQRTIAHLHQREEEQFGRLLPDVAQKHLSERDYKQRMTAYPRQLAQEQHREQKPPGPFDFQQAVKKANSIAQRFVQHPQAQNVPLPSKTAPLAAHRSSKTTSPPQRADAATATRDYEPVFGPDLSGSQNSRDYRAARPVMSASPYKLGRPSQAWPSPKRRSSRPASASWTEQANVNEYDLMNDAELEADLRTSFYEASQRTKENQLPKRRIDPQLRGLFEECREVIYRSAAAFISENEAEPYFLMELFKKASRLDTSFARQKLLIEMDKIVAVCDEGQNDQQQRRPQIPTRVASSITERVQTPFNDSHFDSPAKDSAGHAFSVGGDSITEGRRSMAPSPSDSVRNASTSMHTVPAASAHPASVRSTFVDAPATVSREAEDVASIVQDMLIAFMARMREPVFTPAHVADMQLIVLAAVSKHLETSEQLGLGSLRDLLQPVLDDAFIRYVGRHAAEVGSVLIEEVGRIVCDVIYVTEEELARSEERMRRDVEDFARHGVRDEMRSSGVRGNGRFVGNDSMHHDARAINNIEAKNDLNGMIMRNDRRTQTPSVGSESRMRFFEQSPTPPRGRQRNVVPATAALASAAAKAPTPPQAPSPRQGTSAYHYGADCHDEDCRWDHDALDGVVRRLSTKHEWGAIMQAIQRVEQDGGPAGLAMLRDEDGEEEEEWETESDEEDEDDEVDDGEEDSVDGSDSAEDEMEDVEQDEEYEEDKEEEEEYETVDDMQYRYDAGTKAKQDADTVRVVDDRPPAPVKEEATDARPTAVPQTTNAPSSSTSRTVTPDISRVKGQQEQPREDENKTADATCVPSVTAAMDTEPAEREA